MQHASSRIRVMSRKRETERMKCDMIESAVEKVTFIKPKNRGKKGEGEHSDQVFCLDFDLNVKTSNCSSIIIIAIINSEWYKSMYLHACIEMNNAHPNSNEMQI